MRLPRVRLTLRRSMALVAVAAVALVVFIRLAWPPPRYRHVEVFHRSPSGSIQAVERMTFDLHDRGQPAPLNDRPSGESRFRRQVDHLEAVKAEYKVSSPRGFGPDGGPIP